MAKQPKLTVAAFVDSPIIVLFAGPFINPQSGAVLILFFGDTSKSKRQAVSVEKVDDVLPF